MLLREDENLDFSSQWWISTYTQHLEEKEKEKRKQSGTAKTTKRILYAHANRTRTRDNSTLQIMVHAGCTVHILQVGEIIFKQNWYNKTQKRTSGWCSLKWKHLWKWTKETYFKLNKANSMSLLSQDLHLLKTRLSAPKSIDEWDTCQSCTPLKSHEK